MTPELVFRDPYVLDFLELHNSYPPIGLILCSEKGKEQVEILFLPEDKIKVSEYITKLPPKELFAEKLNKAIKAAQLKLERG